MTDRYLLLETGSILTECREQDEALEMLMFMQILNPDNCYKIIAEDLY